MSIRSDIKPTHPPTPSRVYVVSHLYLSNQPSASRFSSSSLPSHPRTHPRATCPLLTLPATPCRTAILSGGQKQRLGWCRLYYKAPKFAMIDEGERATQPPAQPPNSLPLPAGVPHTPRSAAGLYSFMRNSIALGQPGLSAPLFTSLGSWPALPITYCSSRVHQQLPVQGGRAAVL